MGTLLDRLNMSSWPNTGMGALGRSTAAIIPGGTESHDVCEAPSDTRNGYSGSFTARSNEPYAEASGHAGGGRATSSGHWSSPQPAEMHLATIGQKHLDQGRQLSRQSRAANGSAYHRIAGRGATPLDKNSVLHSLPGRLADSGDRSKGRNTNRSGEAANSFDSTIRPPGWLSP